MTPHIGAKKDQIAERILLPGDPLRAKFISENYLENPYEFNSIRNMLGYTGLYKGFKVSVMGTGMGIPSMAIYAKELIDFYGVKKIIRVGSCGSYDTSLDLSSIILASSASTDSNIANQLKLGGHVSASPDFDLLLTSYNRAQDLNLEVKLGPVLTSDLFYDFDQDLWKHWRDIGILAVEMETYGLYLLSQIKKVQSLSILTVSDSLVGGEELSPEKRQKSFDEMIVLALETIIN